MHPDSSDARSHCQDKRVGTYPQPVSKQRLMHGARLSQPFCPVDSSSASISRLHPYGPPLASPSICMLGSGRQRRKDDCPISSMIVLSYTIVQPTAMAMRYSMTARRGPNWLRPRLLATAASCTRLFSIHWATIIKRPTPCLCCACVRCPGGP